MSCAVSLSHSVALCLSVLSVFPSHYVFSIPLLTLTPAHPVLLVIVSLFSLSLPLLPLSLPLSSFSPCLLPLSSLFIFLSLFSSLSLLSFSLSPSTPYFISSPASLLSLSFSPSPSLFSLLRPSLPNSSYMLTSYKWLIMPCCSVIKWTSTWQMKTTVPLTSSLVNSWSSAQGVRLCYSGQQKY